MQTAATISNANDNAPLAQSFVVMLNALVAKLVLIIVVLHAHTERDEWLT